MTGGTYYRTYSNSGSGPTSEADPASISGFRLDKYLVTVGRFRQFVAAWSDGYYPASGSGVHTYLNDGLGLVNSGARSGDAGDGGGEYESGWSTSWNSYLAPTDTNLTSCSPYATWTGSAGSQESLPIDCVNWYESYAFCIWDGGFLPSEAEWEYAAAGGSQQREYPWGSTPPPAACPATGCSYAIWNCDYPSGATGCSEVASLAPVGTTTLGAGLWGQFDLAGEVWEWALDWSAAYVSPCADCADLTASSARAVRGGSFASPTAYLSNLFPPSRGSYGPVGRGDSGNGNGFRCSRAP